MEPTAPSAVVAATAPVQRIRTDIEGLRAVAVALVLSYHFFPTVVSGGYIGVDVFFVISGYLITKSLVDAWSTSPTGVGWLLDFWARRFRRLLPNALAVLLAVSLVGALFLSGFSLRRLGSDVFWAALYSANWLFVLRSIDYLAWDETQRGILLNFWSLAVEEQFYLVWPLLLGPLLLGSVRPDLSSRRARWAIVLILIASIGYMAWQGSRNRTVAFFATPARAWELLLGAALTMRWASKRLAGLPEYSRSVGLVLILIAALWFDEDTSHPGWPTLLPVLGAALVVRPVALSGRGWAEPLVARCLACGPMQYLGSRSYSVYLWHWPVLVLGTKLWPGGQGWHLSILLIFALLLAELAYRFIEVPGRFGWTRGLSSRRVVLYALTFSLGVAGVGFVLRASASSDFRELLGMTVAPDPLRLPSMQVISDDLPVIYQNGCHLPLKTERSPPCEFGRSDGARSSVVLFGDSHAAQWFSALDLAARAAGMRLMSWTKSSCPSIDVPIWNGVARSVYGACDVWREDTLQRIEALRPRWVILSNFVESQPPVADRASGRAMRPLEAAEAWTEGLERVIRRLQRAGIAVVVIRDVPRPRSDVLDCLFATARPETCELGQAEAQSTPALDLAAAAKAGATVWDFSDHICPGGHCQVWLPSQRVVVYRDSNHLTDSYVRSLREPIGQAWRAMVAAAAGRQAGR